MNIYRTEFFALCPVNGVRIKYRLEIRTKEVIPVEQIVARVEAVGDQFHEEIADQLLTSFGGEQSLIAEHHGVQIETHRTVTSSVSVDAGKTDRGQTLMDSVSRIPASGALDSSVSGSPGSESSEPDERTSSGESR